MFCSLKGWVKRCYTDRQLLIREQNILTIFSLLSCVFNRTETDPGV